MVSRRTVALGLAASPFLLNGQGFALADDANDVYQLDYPDIGAITDPVKFGYGEADAKEKAKAEAIIKSVAKGPKAIDIAQDFVDKYFKSDPGAISQWPRPAHWNPLIVEFFSATSLHANNDMVAWCAAFANWCLKRAGNARSNNAASQSFLDKSFQRTITPVRGDLAVFTCYDPKSGKSVGLGHVTFFKKQVSDGVIVGVGGNQSADGHSSVICEGKFTLSDYPQKRHLGDKYVDVVRRLNCFIHVG